MNTCLMLRSGRYCKNKLWQKQNKLITLPVAMHHIQIPPRIERGPTDILKALSSTIKVNSDLEEYKYQYGRTFNISSIYKKRLVSLSMESGRKAAKWVVNENPMLFQHRSADPYIEAFSPPKVFDENSEVSEETLIEMIQEIRVKSAIKVYELLKEKGFDVSNSTKQQLLELVCFYNSTEKTDETLLEMNYFQNPQPEVSNTWDSEGFSMKLFSEMERNLESYSAMILGMFKYNNVTDALALYKEADDKGIVFDVNVYNSLLENSFFESYHYSDQRDIILEVLNKMEKENIEPNLETLNSVLKATVAMRKWFKSREFAWSAFAEFTHVGIKPSLATYYYLLEIFLDRTNANSIFNFILHQVGRMDFTLQDVDDLKFFSKMMEKCAHNLKCISMAYKINNLLNTGNNRDFLCRQYHEAIYYRSFLRLLFEYENLDLTMKIYSELVPTNYLPDIGTFLVILNCLKLRNGIQCLPRIWSDIKNMTVSDSEKILESVISIIDIAGSDSTKEMDILIAKEAWENVEAGKMRTGWNSEFASAFVKIFSRCEDAKMAYNAYDFAVFLKDSNVILNFDSRSSFINLCKKIKDKRKALECIKYSADVEDNNLEKLVKQFTSSFALEKNDLILLGKYTKSENKIKEFLC